MSIQNIDWGVRDGYGYTRESKGDAKAKAGRTTRSCGEQEDLIRAWVADAGLTLRHVYSDDVSASDYGTREREDWLNLVAELQKAPPNTAVLVCFAVSRMSRDSMVWAPLVHLCRERGVLIVVDGKVYDVQDGRDEFALIIFFAVATMQSRETSVNVQRAINANGAAGKPHGGHAYGYERQYHPVTREFLSQVPKKDEAEVVNRIFTELATGKSCHAVSQGLNRDGVVAAYGGTWSTSSVYNLAHRKAYLGIRVHNGVETKAVWPALVTPERYWAVQRQIATRARTKAWAPKQDYLLTTIMMCGKDECPASCRVAVLGGNRKYMCREHGHAVVPAEAADGYVEGVLLAYLADERNFLRLTAADDAAIAGATADLERAHTELAELAALAPTMSPAVAASMDKALQERIARATKAIASATVPPVLRDLVGPEARRQWAGKTMTAKRTVLRATMDVTLLPAGRRHTVPIERRIVIKPKSAYAASREH